MARILLALTGSVAAIRAGAVAAGIRAAGHDVRVMATRAAMHFVGPGAFRRPDAAELRRMLADTGAGWTAADLAGERAGAPVLLLDEDEWPSPADPSGPGWRRDDPVPHIELRRWADVLVFAPLDANTLAKLAAGLSDNLPTCVYRAWDFRRPVVLAPAMNTLMWESPLTARHLAALHGDHSDRGGPDRPESPAGPASTAGPAGRRSADGWVARINADCPRLRIVGPIEKRLACGDVGVGAMAEPDAVVAAVAEAVDSSVAPPPAP